MSSWSSRSTICCEDGFLAIAIARGKDKEELVRKLSARQCIDSKSQNAVEELVKLGGTKIILGAVPSAIPSGTSEMMMTSV
jgi:D-arabinose 1-dehydrogenase-like Zn-dependent alcohol dehydrogenase